MRPRLLVIQPDALDPLDRFADLLDDEGLDVELVRPFVGERIGRRIDADALLVLGGDMSADHDDEFPWLNDVRHLIGDAAQQSRPILGICLGAQLLAQTFGGTVTVGSQGLEAGIVDIQWRPTARADALLADLPAPFRSGAMHRDTIATLPPGSVWLGQSETYQHQAFRVGDSAWGVQFHPEVSAATYSAWVAAFDRTDIDGLNRVQEGQIEFDRSDSDVAVGTSILARRFASVVRDATRSRPLDPAVDRG